jgi:hypothetical protein
MTVYYTEYIAYQIYSNKDNYRLNVENKMLRDENNMLKRTQRTIFCPSCTDEPRKLQILQEIKTLKSQNERMRQEVQHITMNLSLLFFVGLYTGL